MASPQSTAVAGQPASDSLTIRLRGREYPFDEGTAPQPVADVSEQRRNEAAIDRLWQELPFASLAPECADRSEIVKRYTDSIVRLHEQHRAIDRLFATMCRVNLEFQTIGPLHADQRHKAVRAKEREMLERGRFKPFLDDGTLTAQLAAQPPELIRLRLTESLRKLATKLVREVFAALDRFASGQTVGLIEWFGDDACLFHFFSETVVQQETGQHQKRGRKRRRRIDRGTMEVTQTVTHVTEGTNVHRHARHEHHLMCAKACRPGEQVRPVPEPAWRLVQAIPPWLQPQVRIVEGDCIRERIIEREVRTDPWRKEQKETIRELQSVHYHVDPAITLDCYVLTGWGDCAIRQEEERQELLRQDRERTARRGVRQQDTITAGQKLWLAGGATALLQGVAMAVFVLSTVAPPLVILATLLMLGGLVPLRAALRLFAASRVRQPDWRYVTHGMAAGLAFFAGVYLMVLGGLLPMWPLLFPGVGCLPLAYTLGRQTMFWYRQLPELPC
jgi:hypothetical protein